MLDLRGKTGFDENACLVHMPPVRQHRQARSRHVQERATLY
jgi:hypothetical protein